MANVQSRHVEGVTSFLNRIKDEPVKSTALEKVDGLHQVKGVIQRHGFAYVTRRGPGAEWTITDAGKEFLSERVAA